MTWFRSVRWRFLLRSIADVPKKRLFVVSSVGFAAILLLPFRLGEFVRPYMIRTPPGQVPGARPGSRPISLTAAASSVVAERVIDGLYISIVLVLALLFVPTVHPLPDRVVGLPVTVAQVRMSGYAMFGLFTVAFTTIAVFYFARSWAHRATLAVVGKVSIKLAERLAGMAENFADGLHILSRGRDAFGFLLETSAYWILNALGMWLLAWGCGVVHADGSAPSLGEAFALMGFLGCAVLIPGPPGMLGVFQAGIYAGMTMFYPTSVVTGAGAAYVFLMYASQCLFQVLLGGVGLAMERGGSRPGGRIEATVARARSNGRDRFSPPFPARAPPVPDPSPSEVGSPAAARLRGLGLEPWPSAVARWGSSKAALVGIALSGAPRGGGRLRPAYGGHAKSTYESPYGFERTWNAALRMVRVDNGWKITEKDETNGYLPLRLRRRDPRAPRRRPARSSWSAAATGPTLRTTRRIERRPRAAPADAALPRAGAPRFALASKMRREYGDAPEPRKPPPPPPEPIFDARSG